MCEGRFCPSRLDPTGEMPPGRIPVPRGAELLGLAAGDGSVRRRLRAPVAATSRPMRRKSFCKTESKVEDLSKGAKVKVTTAAAVSVLR